MKKLILTTTAIALLSTTSALADDKFVFPVAGKVMEVTDKKVTVMRFGDRKIFDIVIDKKTEVPASIKAGDYIVTKNKIVANSITMAPKKPAPLPAAKPAAKAAAAKAATVATPAATTAAKPATAAATTTSTPAATR